MRVIKWRDILNMQQQDRIKGEIIALIRKGKLPLYSAKQATLTKIPMEADK